MNGNNLFIFKLVPRIHLIQINCHEEVRKEKPQPCGGGVMGLGGGRHLHQSSYAPRGEIDITREF